MKAPDKKGGEWAIDPRFGKRAGLGRGAAGPRRAGTL